ncbi:hypothetical protein [Actinomadura oligospora]|uniref:hypothetical protein n=1 Tax=Actinomadura oligospora TaxID=111804 RepID=UPI000478ECF7|nr:hypothetical protein [Actinomadura oligospora]
MPQSHEAVFDPTLPSRMLADLESGSGALVLEEPGTPPSSHRFLRQRALSGTATMGVVLAVVATLAQVADWWLVLPVAAIGPMALQPWNAIDRRNSPTDWRVLRLAWGPLISWLAPLGTGGLGAWAACQIWPHYFFLLEATDVGVTHVMGRDRLVSLADLGDAERARLSRVRAVREQVEEAQRLLAPAFDGTLVLMTLREQEWMLATRMGEMAPLAAEVDHLDVAAATDRVRQAMRPQAEVVAAARRADEAVIERIEEYARPVERAILAHREWEQIQQLADNTDAYPGLLARAEAGGTADDLAGAPALDRDFGLEAARLAREDLTTQAVGANAWLLKALRGDQGR